MLSLDKKIFMKKMKITKPDVKEITLDIYYNSVLKVIKICKINNIDDFKYMRKVYLLVNKSTKSINSVYRLIQSIKFYLISINYDKKIIDDYIDLIKFIKNKLEKLRDSNLKSEKEETNWITMDEINEKKKELTKIIKDGFIGKTPSGVSKLQYKINTLQSILLLKLYTEYAPRRLEYSNVFVYDDLKDVDTDDLDTQNYLLINEKKIILNNYKTSNTYKKFEMNISSGIIYLVKQLTEITKTNFMLVNSRNQTQMTNNSLSQFLRKIFKDKAVSVNLFRHLYVSDKYPNKHSINEMKETAYNMGHSISTQSAYNRIQ